MPICKYCKAPFQWGSSEDRFVLLAPVGHDEGLPKVFVDADGTYRADHRAVCTRAGGPLIKVVRLHAPIPAERLLVPTGTGSLSLMHEELEALGGDD